MKCRIRLNSIVYFCAGGKRVSTIYALLRCAILFICSVSGDHSSILSLGSLQSEIFHNASAFSFIYITDNSIHIANWSLIRIDTFANSPTQSARTSYLLRCTFEQVIERVKCITSKYGFNRINSVDTFTCSTCSCIFQIHLSHANIHWWRSHEPHIHRTCNVHF